MLSDHKALSFLLNCHLLHPRLVRWYLKIQGFNFRIKNIPGKNNVIADTISRYGSFGTEDDNIAHRNLIVADIVLNTAKELKKFGGIKNAGKRPKFSKNNRKHQITKYLTVQ